jgi:tRNA pseudouridine38-40 synthase
MEIGRGKLPPEVMKEILETRNRKAAGETAPAHGLCLIYVFYDDYWFLDQYDTSGNS